MHLHTEPLKLTGTISGKELLVYYTVNILNTFTEQTSATGDVCWIYCVNCWKLKLLKSNCTFLRVCYRLNQQNKHDFCSFDWSKTDGKNVLTEWSHSPFYIIWLYLNTWQGFCPSHFFPLWMLPFCLRLHFGLEVPTLKLFSAGIQIFFCLN